MQTKSVLSQWRKEERKLQTTLVARKKHAEQLCCQLFWPILSKVHYFSFTIGACSVRNVQFAKKDVPGCIGQCKQQSSCTLCASAGSCALDAVCGFNQ